MHKMRIADDPPRVAAMAMASVSAVRNCAHDEPDASAQEVREHGDKHALLLQGALRTTTDERHKLRQPCCCARLNKRSRLAMRKWWSQAGSNRRPLACHASALPAELWPHAAKEVSGTDK